MRLGIVGYGRQGAGHARHWTSLEALGVEVVGVADPTPARLDAAGADLGLEPGHLHARPIDLIARDDIDAISVTSPQRFHPEVVLAAAVHGKHVLCEKPIANAPIEGAAMVEACRRAGVVLGMVHNYLWYDDGVKAVLDSGAIGRPLVVLLNALGVIDHPGIGAYRPTWRHTLAEAGGGVLTDMLHYVYLVAHLLGAPIGRVAATVDRRLSDDQDVEDTALCRFGHVDASGRIVGHSIVNVAWGEGPGGLDVMGERGRVRLHYKEGGTLPFVPPERIEVWSPDGYESRPAVTTRDGQAIFRDFVAAVREGRDTLARGETGVACLEAVVAVYASAALGCELALPLDRDSPLHQRGTAGIAELDLPADSVARRLRLFGL